MKRLKVPYLPTLDVLDLSSAGILLETRARREYIDTVNWAEYPYKPVVAFDIARSDTKLYIRYFVKGNSLKAESRSDNTPVHRDSCVEFFMQKLGDSEYMNFEFNCIGVCDASRRQSRHVKQSLSAEEYASIKRYSTLESKPFTEKLGVFAWELIVSIPFTVMGLDPEHLPTMIRGNFYKCADDTAHPHFLSWSPIKLPQPDFHCPSFFGDIYL